MSELNWPDGPVINRQVEPHNCFGCGTLNPSGLQLEFRSMPGGVWSSYTFTSRFEGYADMVHGGIVCTLLDEAMSWAINAIGAFAVTARMSTSFKHPVQTGTTVHVEGRVIRQRRRLIDASAAVVDPEAGTTLASAEGVFMRVSDEQAAAWRARYVGG